MNTPNRALNNLFSNLVKTQNWGTLGHLVDLLDEEGRARDIDWTVVNAKRTLAHTTLTLLFESNKKKKIGDYTDKQEKLARLLLDAGAIEGPDQAIFQSALGWGMGVFTGVIAKEKNWKDTRAIEEKLTQTNVLAVMNLLVEWEEIEVLSQVRKATMDYLSKEAWLKKGMKVKDIDLIRRDIPWTEKEADQYMIQRLWPDWKARQYSYNVLDVCLDPVLARDGVMIVEKISPQAWQNTVFANYKGKDAEIFCALGAALGDKISHLNIPTPEWEWMEQYLNDRALVHYKNEKKSPPEFELMVIQRYIDQAQQQGWSWDSMGQAMACFLVAHLTDKNTETIKPNDGLANHLLDMARRDLGGVQPQPRQDWIAHTMTNWGWIQTADSRQLRDFSVVEEPQLNSKDKFLASKTNTFHRIMAQAYEARLVQETDSQVQKVLARGYWRHLLRNPGTYSAPAVRRIMNMSPEEAAPYWNVEPGDEVLAREVENAQPKVKKSGGQAQKALAACLLRLTAAMVRGEENKAAVSSRPKM